MKLMRLPRMQQAEPIPPLLQCMVEVLTVACRRLHSDEDLLGERIQLRKFVQQNVPSLLCIGKGEGFDHQAFVQSVDTARTGLASDVNPTDILEWGFLL